MDKLKEIYYDVIKGIKNVFTWFPIVWSDRDWDYAYILIMLDKKLEKMSKHHAKGRMANSTEIQQTLDELRETINRILEEDYEDEAFLGNEDLLEKREITFTELEDGNYLVNFEGLTEEEEEKFRECVKKEDILHQDDINKLFDTMKDDIQKWWD